MDLDKLRARRDELNVQITEEARLLFKKASAELFTKHPNLMGFRWTQCTPHFNDGDACTFRAHTSYFYLQLSDDEKYTDFQEARTWGLKPENKHFEVITDIHNFLDLFDNDDFENMFGDHAEITVTRTGMEVSEYEHD